MGQIIRVNLSTETISKETLKPVICRVLSVLVVWVPASMEEVSPQVDSEPREQAYFYDRSPTGTLAASAGRYTNVTRGRPALSPPSNSGGNFGPELKFAGVTGLLLKARPKAGSLIYNEDVGTAFGRGTVGPNGSRLH